MSLPLIVSLDEVLLQVESYTPRKSLFWGEGVGGISSYAAGWMAGRGIDVIVLDGANRFDPYRVSSFAKKASIPPVSLLKRIRIARAFTCYQMATLIEERLVSSLEQTEEIAQQQKPWVILLGLVTPFLDEDVSEREVRPLFERSLRRVEGMAAGGIPFFLFEPSAASDSKRAYLTRRLFQFSDLIWRISLDDEEPKIVIEKGLTANSSLNSKHEIRDSKKILMTKTQNSKPLY
jgi:hypothetical protein